MFSAVMEHSVGKMAENSRFGKLSTAKIQEIIDNFIAETKKNHKLSQLTNYLEFDIKRLIEKAYKCTTKVTE